MMKPWSIALFMAHPPMPKIITYMQKLSNRSTVAMDFICELAIWAVKSERKSWVKEEEQNKKTQNL